MTALIAPHFIDWANYRADFERQAGHVLGREVRVDGAARARLLPFPSVTFSDVVVAGRTPEEPAMTIEEFSMDAELAPFLRGEFLIFDMRLVRPRAQIEIDATGRIDWTVRPSSPSDLINQVMLERLRIIDGHIVINQRAGGRSIALEHINSELSARSLAGPWRMDGTLDAGGLPLVLSGSTGTASPDGMRIRLSAQSDELPFTFEMDGQASLEQGAAHYAGTFDLRSVVEKPEGEAAATTAVSGNRVTGRFNLNHERLAVEEFRLAAGSIQDPYTADGHAEIAFGAEPFFSIVADGAQIRWNGSESEDTSASRITALERLSAFTSLVASLPKPVIPGTVAVNLPAIVAGDTTIRDISIQAEPVGEGWSIGSIAATLPGRTRFEGSGLLAVGEEVSFSGKMLLAVAQPSGFAMWVARDVDDAIRRLSGAGFSADVSLSNTQQTFENLELILGSAKFGGRIERQSPASRRPSVAIALDGGKLDLDALRAFGSLFIDENRQNRLSDNDVDLTFSAGPVVARGFEAEKIETELRLREQVLEIDRFSATGLAGANISATGRIDDVSANRAGSIDATVVAVDLAPLIDLLAEQFPNAQALTALARHSAAYPGLLAEASVDVLANHSTEDSATIVSVKGKAGGTDFRLQAKAFGQPISEEKPVEAHFTATNPEASALYALVGLPSIPLGLAGEATLEADIEGALADGAATSIKFSGDGLRLSFDGTLTRADQWINSRGQVELVADDLDPWLAAAGIALPGFGYGLPVNLKAKVDVGEQLAVISDLKGSFVDTEIYGDLNAELHNHVPHITGSLNLNSFDLALPVEMLTGIEALQPGDTQWPETSFQHQASLPFTTDVELEVDHLWLGASSSAEAATMRLKLDPDKLELSALSAKIFGGTIEGLTEFRNDEGTGLLSAQLSLNGASLGDLLPKSGLAGTTRLSATIAASGKSINAVVASMSGSGAATISDLLVPDLNPQALPVLIAKADELGAEIEAPLVGILAPDAVRGGSFTAGSTELAFVIANGIARFPPLQLKADGARMSVEGAANFRDRTVSATGNLIYEQGLDAVVGSEPMVRFSVNGAPNALMSDLDTEPLAQFLTQRALEREQERVEHMQSVLLETQRLRREQRYFEQQVAIRTAEEAERVRLEREAERSRKASEEARQQRLEAERLAQEEQRQREIVEQIRREAERRDQLQRQAPPPLPRVIPQPMATPPQVLPQSDPASFFSQGQNTTQPALTEEENLRRLQQMFRQR